MDWKPLNALLLTWLALTGHAHAGFSYVTNANDTLTITRCTRSSSTVTIPATIQGRRVSCIGREAFAGCTGLVNVEIPAGVSRIQSRAFAGCIRLRSLILPARVSTIENEVFTGCSHLSGIYFMGNAPAHGAVLGCKATVYYRRGTSGWTTTWAGCRTVPLDADAPVLAVAPLNRNRGAGACEVDFTVTSRGGQPMKYRVSEGSSWMNIVSGGAGTNAGTVRIACASNPLTVTRTGTLTVISVGAIGSPACATIVQAPGRPLLSVTPACRNVDGGAGTTTFAVANLGGGSLVFQASENNAWMEILKSGVGTNRGTLTVSFQQNPGSTSRTGTVTVTAAGAAGSPVHLKVIQSGKPILSVVPEIRRAGYGEGSVTFAVTNAGGGTMTYAAAETEEWLVLTGPTSGGNSGTLRVEYTANPGATTRTGMVTVTAPGAMGSRVRVKVVQSGRPVLAVAPGIRAVGSSAGTATFTVTNAGEGAMTYAVTEAEEWLIMAGATGGGNSGTLRIDYSANPGATTRTGTVTVTAPGAMGSPVRVTIIQSGRALLAVSPLVQRLDYRPGSVSFAVTNAGGGRMAYTAGESETWMEIVRGGSGGNHGMVTIMCQTNSRVTDRTGHVWVAASGALDGSQRVAIVQAGMGTNAWIRINEYMASNEDTLADEEGDFVDWIELYNSGSTAVNMEGWGLTDDEEQPFRWVFPDVTMEPGNFLLVYASGKDRWLHANFKISSGGEQIQVTRSDGSIADRAGPVQMPQGITYGRQPDGNGGWAWFPEATPAAANVQTGYAAILEPPEFSEAGGFHTNDLVLGLSHADPEATIVYTLDGSVPDPDHLGGKTYCFKNQYPQAPGDPFGEMLSRTNRSHVFAGPMQLSDPSDQPYELAGITTSFLTAPVLPTGNILKARVVRARAIKAGSLPSPVATRTFFIQPDMPGRYALPVFSIVTEEAHLFDYVKGIYVPGKIADDWRRQNPESDGSVTAPANYYQRGKDWERDAHVEVYRPDGQVILSQDIGIRINGGASRSWRLKQLRLVARDSADGADSFPNAFFPERRKLANPGETIPAYTRLLLRQSGGEGAESFYRDAFMQGLVSHLPLATMAYQPAIHFINGEYWGMINIREYEDEDYLAVHYGVDEDDLAILSNYSSSLNTGTTNDRNHFLQIVDYATGHDLSVPEHYDWVAQRVDVDDLALYYAVQIYINNGDWPVQNADWWRRRTSRYMPEEGVGRDGRWRWLLKDTDFGFGHVGSYTNNALARVMDESLGDVNRLFQALLDNDTFRHLFITKLADSMNSAFAPGRVKTMLDEYETRILPYRAEHNARWRSNTRAQPAMYSFAANRPAAMRRHVLEEFGLPGVAAVTVATDPSRGRIQVNGLVIDSQLVGHSHPEQPYPWTGIYFQGVPLRLTAMRKPGYRFAGWEEYPEVQTETLDLMPTGPMTVTARFEESAPVRLVHYWNFNDGADLLKPSHSVGTEAGITFTAVGGGAVTTGTQQGFWGENARLGDGAGVHMRVNQPIGSSLDVAMPTTGFEDIVVQYETRRSGSGAGLHNIAYTLDGIHYVGLESRPITETPSLVTLDFAGIPGADDNGRFGIRITFAQGTGGDEGNNRFDNWTVEGCDLNLPPSAAEDVPCMSVVAGQGETAFDLRTLFRDRENDALEFRAEAEDPAVAGVDVSGSMGIVTPLQQGATRVHVTASDDWNFPVAAELNVLVQPQAHDLKWGNYVFSEWDPHAPAGSFPAHMLFVRSRQSDPTGDAPLDCVYGASSGAVGPGYPYAAETGSRINGRGSEGISFFNTGDGRDLGGALLALDTRGMTNVPISWRGGTVIPNDRTYGIRLQYRAGSSGPFLDLLDASGQPIEYVRQDMAGHEQVMQTISLPPVLMGQEYLQLLWRYFYISGTGSCAQLRLDDILVAPWPNGYAAWHFGQFNEAERADPLISGPHADPDASGMPNLMRYAMGLERHDPVERVQVQGRISSNGSIFRHRRLIVRDGALKYGIEMGRDLQAADDWRRVEPGADLQLLRTIPSGDGRTEFIDYLVPPADKSFYRLNISLEE